ncbi:MAG: M28 family peptidase, partial [Myxococcaceae bacterium]
PEAVPGIGWSDHASFWKQGYPAVMITDTAFYRNPRYHKAEDTADTLDYARMAEAAKGVFGAVMALDAE